MQARNDATVAGAELVAAFGRLLPRVPKRKVPKARISSPSPGLLRFAVGAGSEDVTAYGVWHDTAETSALFLRRVFGRKPPALVRLVFHDGMLAVNSLTITATAVAAKPARRRRKGIDQLTEPPSPAEMPLWQAVHQDSATPSQGRRRSDRGH